MRLICIISLQLSDQADRDPEVAWKEWIAGKYGITDEESELILASALRKSYEVVRKVFFEFGVRTNDHSHIPNFFAPGVTAV